MPRREDHLPLWRIYIKSFWFCLLGRGVVAAKDFESGDFIAYLIGQRLSELTPDTDKSFLIEIETGGRFVWYVHQLEPEHLLNLTNIIMFRTR